MGRGSIPPLELALHEEVALLALRNDTGALEWPLGSLAALAQGGALLADLVLAGAVDVEATARGLVTAHGAPKGRLLASRHRLIAAAPRRTRAAAWVVTLGDLSTRLDILRGLCRKGVLRESERRILLLFKQRVFPEVDPGPERRVRLRLRDAIVTDRELDAPTEHLLAVAHACGLTHVHIDRALLRARRDRLARIVQGNAVGAATMRAVAAVSS